MFRILGQCECATSGGKGKRCQNKAVTLRDNTEVCLKHSESKRLTYYKDKRHAKHSASGN